MKSGYIKSVIILAAVFTLAFQANSQGVVSQKAVKNELMLNYLDASDSYRGLYQRGDREASLQAARNLYKANRPLDALPLFEYADSLKIMTDYDQVFAFFECLKAAKRYQEADVLVKSRLGEFASRPEFGLNVDKMGFYDKVTSFKGASLTKLDLNSKYSEMSPVLYNGWLYFVSTRRTAKNSLVHRINMQPFYNLYGVPETASGAEVAMPVGEFGKAEGMIKLGDQQGPSLPRDINKKFHDGPVYVTPSGNMMFFTSNHVVKKGGKNLPGYNLRLFYSEKQGNTWQTPKELPGNSEGYSNQHAYFDEKTSTLYFTSNRAGGQGNWDIWKMTKSSDGSWSEAQNLGAGINTPKTEVFPSLSPDGQLIFSSNGWAGLGGLDLFIDGGEKEPLNLLAGMNSELDDFGLVFTSKDAGYVVSNRPGGAGDDDIYKFGLKLDMKEIRSYNRAEKQVQVVVKDSKTGQPVSGVTAKITRDGQQTTANLTSGGTLTLSEGDVVSLQAEGYDAVTMPVSASVMDTGRVEASMNPTEKPEPMASVQATDAQTGAVVPAEVTVTRNDAATSVGAGQTYAYKAGDRLKVTAAGYAPVELVVTEEMIASGKIGASMMKEPEGLTKVAVSASDVKGSAILPVQVTVNRAKSAKSAAGSYTTNLFGAGDGLSLTEGDELVIVSAGYEPATVKVNKTMLRKKEVKAILKALPMESTGKPEAIAASGYGPIYYAYKKWDLSASAKSTLDKLVRDMNANPNMRVELRSYADCRGNADSNVRLSEQRMQSAIQYVQSRISGADRITGSGFGESVLVNDCGCEGTVRSGCKETQHRLNRRSEFAILKR